MKPILILVFLFNGIISRAQNDSLSQVKAPVTTSETYSTLIEQMPEFPGGEQAMMYFINENLVYPKMAIDSTVEGTVIIRFTVTVNGDLTNMLVLLSKEKLGFGLEEAAINVIKKMPRWKPGKQNGEVVPLTYSLPVDFRLRNIPRKITTPEPPEPEKEDKTPDNVFLISTVKPQFRGGQRAMNQFISETLIYPKAAIENKIEGKVTLKFIVDSTGKICCIGFIGEAIGYGIEDEARRILKAMPLWTPAYTDGIPVAVYYRLPITFKYYEE